MIGKTLFRYFFRRYLLIVLQFFVGISTITYIIDLTEFLRRASNWDNYTFGGAMAISVIKLPVILQEAVPFIILAAAMTALMTFNRKFELVIARSAGVSAWQFLAPLCLASFLVGIAAVTILNPLAANGLTWVLEAEAVMQGKSADPADDDRIPWMSQRTEEGLTVIGASRTARRGTLLRQAVFLRYDEDGTLTDRYDAETAVLRDGHWRLNKVSHIDAERDRESLERLDIESGLSVEHVEERLARPDSIPFYELAGKIETARALGLKPDAFAMQFHSLVALPALLVAMTLIAATVSMRFVRMGQSVTMILGGVVAGFLLYVVTVLVRAFGEAGVVAPVIAAWTPVVVAMFFGVTFLLYKEDG